VVLGLGQSGLAMARALSDGGVDVRVADTRAEPPMLAALRAELPRVRFAGGAFDPALLEGATLLALSPGLSPTHSAAAPLVAAAKKAGIEVVGEIELFARALARLEAARGYAPHVVGITGTNGKTTTARLTGLLIERAGRAVAVAGNISPTALDALRERVRDDHLPDVWVLELSSFQLATTRSLTCDAAAVLNVSQDHLDWHGSFDAYARAKARIFSPATVQVLNRRHGTEVGAGGDLPPAAAGAARRVRPGQRRRDHLAGPRRGFRTRPAPASRRRWAGGRSGAALRASADARRRARHPRPAQRRQRARRTGPGAVDRLSARTDAARPAQLSG
jgi:UDP-N-acetylmuramoylalanine--D-glutamate ligase